MKRLQHKTVVPARNRPLVFITVFIALFAVFAGVCSCGSGVKRTEWKMVGMSINEIVYPAASQIVLVLEKDWTCVLKEENRQTPGTYASNDAGDGYIITMGDAPLNCIIDGDLMTGTNESGYTITFEKVTNED